MDPEQHQDAPTPELEYARRTLAAQPFSVHLGARVAAFGDGGATLELEVRDELRQQNGHLHGGVLGYAADNALTFAAGAAAAEPGAALLTTGFSIEYLRPARGVLLRARAHAVRAGRTRITCRCDLLMVDGDGAETLCAIAQGAAAVLPSAPGSGQGE
ncbi:thioesterase [Mangrovactinospora gilvigrisea]|uniref:Thioesterase n=1 Tax=Mangrovactinospora gilvigrisea TaxID=1428644 RepID=A0A1J7BH42_9ACTN|nr:PaaI family thioesterase [Mangrovactinospora gilvigrisea]OIV37893.1 thioesterase [Mangrovactinospora gilvigrisea]